MKVILIPILFICLPPVTTATEEKLTGEEDTGIISRMTLIDYK
jgi:hypothetical protein